MLTVYQTSLLPDAVIVRDMLAGNGIEAQVVGGQTTSASMSTVTSEVWVVRNEDRERAVALIRELERSRKEGRRTQWSCRECRETNPGEFNVCWSCGAARRA